MARSTASFVCQSCGTTAPKWSGKCESCGGWNTITEESAPAPIGAGATKNIDASGNPYVDQFIHGRAEGPIKMEVKA